MYYSPYQPVVTESLTRKPDSLMFEKAMAKFDIDPKVSWMVGDKDRDLIPAKKFDITTILMSDEIESEYADYHKHTFTEVTNVILSRKNI
jgi:D-glycero-D-manno-heptose 1,7-bisphosphate phosphatase